MRFGYAPPQSAILTVVWIRHKWHKIEEAQTHTDP